MSPNVVVVGAGIIGCAIARELAVRGVTCTVFDPRRVAEGATQASAGMLAPYVEAHGRNPLLDLGLQSLSLYQNWIGGLRGEGHFVEYDAIGTLEIAFTAEHAAALRRGAPGGWVGPEDLARAVPELAPTAGAFSIEEHGYVDAPQLARALARSAERHGATFRQARVQRITTHEGVVRLRVDGEDVDAANVVLAAGAWTNEIDGMVTPPLRPVRGQLLHVRWEGTRIPSILWGPDCYIVPRRNGALLVGATVEDVGFDERTTEEGIAGLLEAARSLLPRISGSELIEARVGLRPATPDELPVLGLEPRVPGLIHASGHYRNGVLLAPITAQIVADLVIHRHTDLDLEAFRPERF